MYMRRIKVFLGIIGVVLLVLVGRLVHLQIIQSEDYLKDAEQYLRRPEFTSATRGKILDRNGLILAIDDPCYDLCLDYRFMTAKEEWMDRAGRSQAPKEPRYRPAVRWLLNQTRRIRSQENCSSEQAEAILHRQWQKTWDLARSVSTENDLDLVETVKQVAARIGSISRGGQRDVRELYTSHAVVRGLDGPAAVKIKSQLSDTVGMEIRPSHTRRYPRGQTACHVIGLTGQVDQDEIADHNLARYEPDWLTWQRDSYAAGDLVGKTGAEKLCEGELRGRRGYRIHRGGQLVDEVPSEAGKDVQLTLDAVLQERLTQAFGERFPSGTGAIVVLDVASGEVLALVSIPLYDPNTYRKVEYFKRLTGDKVGLPLWHRAVSQCYPPGSTVKPLAAMAALAAGRLTPEMKFNCDEGRFGPDPDGAPKCWAAKQGYGHGRVDLVEGLRVSCNVYFDYVGQLLGPDQLCNYLRVFGFGELPGTGLPDEHGGLVPSDEWMRKHTPDGRGLLMGEAWQMAIGQGPLLASPLQVANAMATVARGGRFRSPVMVRNRQVDPVQHDVPIDDACVRAIHQGMRQVVHHDQGTAHAALSDQLASLGFEFCGKTGTAVVEPQRIDTDGDGRRETAVRQGDVAWFSGFAPFGEPRIAFAVMVEYVEGGAARNAGPVAVEVLRICKELGYVR